MSVFRGVDLSDLDQKRAAVPNGSAALDGVRTVASIMHKAEALAPFTSPSQLEIASAVSRTFPKSQEPQLQASTHPEPASLPPASSVDLKPIKPK